MRLKKWSSYNKKTNKSAPWRTHFFKKTESLTQKKFDFFCEGDALERPFLFLRLFGGSNEVVCFGGSNEVVKVQKVFWDESM